MSGTQNGLDYNSKSEDSVVVSTARLVARMQAGRIKHSIHQRMLPSRRPRSPENPKVHITSLDGSVIKSLVVSNIAKTAS
jgi:hypothetical protein